MILVFGKNGQLAQSFKATLPKEYDGQTVFVSSQEANFREPNKLGGYLDHYSPEIIIICAAYTQVDLAEIEFDIAENINYRAPQEIARWAARNDCLVIHFSTDYVYSGEDMAPWNEDSPTQPLNKYGATKLNGDEAIQFAGGKHLIFRTSWVYSEYGKNFLKTMIRMAETKTEVSIVSDQFGNPTYAPEIALNVWKIIKMIKNGEKFPSGVYHIAGQGSTSWAEFAEAIFLEAKKLKFEMKIEKVNKILSSEYLTPALRPKNSRLSLEKLKRVFGIEMPTWQESMSLCLRRLK